MIPDEQLHQLCGAPEEPRSTSRTLTVWKPVHEQLYAVLGIQWPPMIPETMVGFTAREAEVVFVADHRWPATEVGVWEFFDANRSMERVFRWQPQQEFDDRLVNPWKSHVPTLVGHSTMACRVKTPDGTVKIKKLHGLEAMRLIGWDLCHWKDGGSPFASGKILPDLLLSMAGNAWSAFAFVPLAMSAFGAALADLFRADDADRVAPSAVAAESVASVSSSDDGSSSD